MLRLSREPGKSSRCRRTLLQGQSSSPSCMRGQVAGASLGASSLVCKRVLGSLIRVAASPAAAPPAGGALALSAILAIVRATRECLTSDPPAEGTLAEAPSAPPGEQAVAAGGSGVGREGPMLAGKGPEVLRVALGVQKPGEASTSEVGQPSAEGLLENGSKVRLQLVGQLASFPSGASPLGAPELEQALQFLLRSICDPRVSPDQPSAAEQDSAAEDDSSSAVAGDALAAMAGQGHDQLLAEQALPQLLQAATSCSSSDSSSSSEHRQQWRGRGALAALSRVAVASGDLRRDVRSALVGALSDSLALPKGQSSSGQ